jgi:hypothetical protein
VSIGSKDDEQRNHGLKYESDCVRIGISISIFMNCGRFWERSYVDVCNFHMSLQFSYEFAIFISVCNSNVTTPALTIIALHAFYVTMT